MRTAAAVGIAAAPVKVLTLEVGVDTITWVLLEPETTTTLVMVIGGGGGGAVVVV